MGIVVLFGKTLSGKSTLVDRLKELGYKPIVEYTTRPIRENEVDGVAYHFVSLEKYEEMDRGGAFAESMHFNTIYGKWWYGALKKDFTGMEDRIVAMGPIQLKQIIDAGFDVMPVLIDVPDEVIIDRAKLRGDDIDEVKRRLENDNHLYDEMRNCAVKSIDGTAPVDDIVDEIKELYIIS